MSVLLIYDLYKFFSLEFNYGIRSATIRKNFRIVNYENCSLLGLLSIVLILKVMNKVYKLIYE